MRDMKLNPRRRDELASPSPLGVRGWAGRRRARNRDKCLDNLGVGGGHVTDGALT